MKPTPQARHRVVRRGNFVASYDPQKELKEQILLTIKKSKILDAPISCELTAYMPIPKSYSKKKKAELLGTEHIKKPDIDNIVKFYFDTFSGTFYEDDSHIATLVAKKLYSNNPRVEIKLVHDKRND